MGWMLHAKLFFLSFCIALSFHATRKKLFYPFSLLWEGIGFIYIYIYIYLKNLFYHPSLLYRRLWEGVDVACKTFRLSSCIALSFHTTRKNCSTLIDSFGRGLVVYMYIYIHVFQESLLSSFMSLPFHTCRKCHSTTHSSKGLSSRYFSIVSSIILPCSISPCFWEGVDVGCQSVLLSSCIALSFHTTRKNYSTLIHSFGR